MSREEWVEHEICVPREEIKCPLCGEEYWIESEDLSGEDEAVEIYCDKCDIEYEAMPFFPDPTFDIWVKKKDADEKGISYE